MDKNNKKTCVILAIVLVAIVLLLVISFINKNNTKDNDNKEGETKTTETTKSEKTEENQKVDFAILTNGKGERNSLFSNTNVENSTNINSDYYGKEIKVENGKVVIADNDNITIGENVIGIAILDLESFLYLNNKNELFRVNGDEINSNMIFNKDTKILNNVASISTILDDNEVVHTFYKDNSNNTFYLNADFVDIISNVNVKYVDGSIGDNKILLLNDSTIAKEYMKANDKIITAKSVFWGISPGNTTDETSDTIYIIDEEDNIYYAYDQKIKEVKKLSDNKVKSFKIDEDLHEIEITYTNNKKQAIMATQVY